MKKITIVLTIVGTILFFNTCALEIANVLGPDGGYVFYDKKNYTFGWRYIQCAPHDFGELRGDISTLAGRETIVREALKKCNDNSADWHKYGWELPTEADIRKMLECFSYGLTRFSPDYYYLAVDNLYDAGRWWVCGACVGSGEDGIKNRGDFCSNCGEPPGASNGWITEKNDPPNPDLLTAPSLWNVKIFHKDFSQELNGTIEEVTSDFSRFTSSGSQSIRVRAIRRF